MPLVTLGRLLSRNGEELHATQGVSALLLLLLPLLHSGSHMSVYGIVRDFTRLSKLLKYHLFRIVGVERIPVISSLCSFRFWLQ